LWSSQSRGVGHYAKYAEKQASKNSQIDYEAVNLQGMLKEKIGDTVATWAGGEGESCAAGSCGTDNHLDKALKNNDARRVYDTPDKGILWGWEVSGYVVTKAISAGVFLLLFIGYFLNHIFEHPFMTIQPEAIWTAVIFGLGFLGATGALLVMDLDQPMRFAYVLLRPQWNSWLVKGGYSISIYGGLISVFAVVYFLGMGDFAAILIYPTAFFAVIVAIYTAFLFAQAKGRDFWQSPTLAFHMLIHSFMAGAAAYMIVDTFIEIGESWNYFVDVAMKIAIIANMFLVLIELTITHPTTDAKKVAHEIVSGRYKNLFWFGSVLVGNIIPFLIVIFIEDTIATGIAGALVIAGIYFTEKIWIEAPQRITLT